MPVSVMGSGVSSFVDDASAKSMPEEAHVQQEHPAAVAAVTMQKPAFLVASRTRRPSSAPNATVASSSSSDSDDEE